PVRLRPGMYIGSTGTDGLHHLLVEIFDNSRDEAMNGSCNEIEVALLPGDIVRVVDNGAGIPVGIHKKTKVSTLETVLTVLHAGGKFGGDGYKISGGLHGVGASVVNALSEWLKAEVHREGGKFVQEYARGKKKYNVKKVSSSKLTGTVITFKPDDTIFSELVYDWNRVVNHLRGQAYLVKSLRVRAIDAREYKGKIDADKAFYLQELGLEVPTKTFYFEGGLLSLIKFYNQKDKPLHREVFYVEKEANEVMVEVALQYVDDIDFKEVSYTNNTITPEGGMHVTGFRTALTRILNDYGKKNNILKESEGSLTGDDVREGMTAVISVKLRNPQFEGQTKAKLGSVEARGAVETVFGEAFSAFLEEHPDDAKAIVSKSILALKARKAAKAAKDSVIRKGALEGMTLPGKLADCQSRDPEESEIFIVEGDSAGGCFAGETKVALADGRNLSFKDLVAENKVGKQNYCYTVDEVGAVQVAPILHPRVTHQNAEVIKIILDNDEEITCTPDHRFMLRDGNYKEAKNLKNSDSLMPLRRQISELGKRITIKGYELVYSPGEHRWIFTHLIADRFNLKFGEYDKNDNEAIHHLDYNKRNNNPDNLSRMDRLEHFFFHTQNLDKTIHREDVKQKAREAHLEPSYRAKISDIMSTPKMKAMLSARAKKQWENEDYKKFMGEKFLEFYRTNSEYRELNNKNLNNEQKKYWALEENCQKQAEQVSQFFASHPEQKLALKKMADEQWASEELKIWRSEKTKKQWTPEFRQKRKIAYRQTYLNRALRALHDIYLSVGQVDVEKYNQLRKETNDKNLIKWGTLCDRFFAGDEGSFKEAVVNFNHRIKRIEKVPERMDVYDIEVAGTHNFALASGVFVHNSGKQGRDRRIQAILPLKGKILNVEKARLDKMLAFKEIKSLIIAMGIGIGDMTDISKLRYHKIIIATDADVDGAHITTLLLTFFFRYYRQLIDAGKIYIAQPPLYKVKKGKEFAYAYSDEEKNKIIKEMGGTVEQIEEVEAGENNSADVSEETETEEGFEDEVVKKKAGKISIQRYKGLGEMNPEELWETTMNPATRIMKQVTIDDVTDADKTFDILMGSEVEPRKLFIQTHAH
ncbi:MAG: ATP-binding protein, partial [Candidatus Vogelbacteria bacterium]|nr:ATP-binding protein [Candidatus Vogelbacteria bacterium]